MSQAFIQFQLRRGSAADWAGANPVLAAGEPGVDLDSRRLKVGDGATPWQMLPYAIGAPVVVLSQSEYDAITPEAGVLYLIGQ
jgi:hypothetical protein